MNPIYFETHFERAEVWEDWPEEFAIITAYAQTGETWPAARNEAADKLLETELCRQARWVQRLTGYSPTTGHAEPGWAVDLTFEAACEIGQRFHQEAIYYVTGDTLTVSYCAQRRAPVLVGTFRARVHLSSIVQSPIV